MFEQDNENSWVETRPEEVLDVYFSINRSTVAPPGYSPEPVQSYITTVYKGGAYHVFIYLYLTHSNAGLLYKSSGGGVVADKVAGLYQTAFQFTESMGFMMDDMRYREKTPEEKAQAFAELPLFHADLSFLKSAEPAGEEGVEELVIEPLNEEGSATATEAEESEELNLDVIAEEEEEPQPAAAEGDGVQEIMLGGGQMEAEAEAEAGAAAVAAVEAAPAPAAALEDKAEENLLDNLEMQMEPAAPEPAPVMEAELSLAADEQTLEAPPPTGAVVAGEDLMTEEVSLTPEEARVLGIGEEAPPAEPEAPAEPEIEEINLEEATAPAAAAEPAAQPELTAPVPADPEPEAAAETAAEPPAPENPEAEPELMEPAPEPEPAPVSEAAAVESRPEATEPSPAADDDFQILVSFLAMM